MNSALKERLDRQAVRDAVHSYFHVEAWGKDGLLKYDSGWRHNLTTDTASGYTNRRDWQAKAMGNMDVNASYVGVADSVTATTLTDTAPGTFPTSGQGLAGRIIACGPNASGAGSTVFGIIVANTATIITIDKWYAPGTLATGTTPNGTCNYQILPGQAPAAYLALTANATAPSAADTWLQDELTTGGYARAIAVYTHTAAASTYSLANTFTATATATLNKTANFGAAFKTANTNDGGVMPFESAMPSPPTLVSGDTVAETETVTIN